MIVVAQDGAGIRRAALEMLEHALSARAVERQLSNVDADDFLQIEKIVPRRTLPDGYYDWAAYLFFLRRKMNDGIQYELKADEAEGLTAISLAVQDFEAKFPRCANCGERGHSPKFCPRRTG